MLKAIGQELLLLHGKPGEDMKSRSNRLRSRIAGTILLLYMMNFASCSTADYCWHCVNPRDPADGKTVCDAMSKNKLTKYGYICTPL